MRHDRGNDEFDGLDEDTKRLVRNVIETVQRQDRPYRVKHGSGEIYAYPDPEGGIAWGITAVVNGHAVRNGVFGGQDQREMREHLNEEFNASVDRENRTYNKLYQACVDRVAGRGVNEEARMDALAQRLYEPEEAWKKLREKLTDAASGLPPREEVTWTPRYVFGQDRNKPKELRHMVAELSVDEFVMVDELANVGHDETSFDKTYCDLKSNPNLSDGSLAKIAEAYCGSEKAFPDRDAALGAIEEQFYALRDSATQKHQNSVRGSR